MVERHVGGNWGHMSWNVYGSHLMITPFPPTFGLHTFSTSLFGWNSKLFTMAAELTILLAVQRSWDFSSNLVVSSSVLNKVLLCSFDITQIIWWQRVIQVNLQHIFTCMDWLTFWLNELIIYICQQWYLVVTIRKISGSILHSSTVAIGLLIKLFLIVTFCSCLDRLRSLITMSNYLVWFWYCWPCVSEWAKYLHL